ncbi:MAG: low molecular weight protein-tyrosine-phosphatase [Pseudomonadota bacterium]|uniref:low molecular weight protein-tyrosine-phosphatase n=1 Tax=Roseovarius TaxID=74030 RepID=UPI0022A89401|nr:low molecular weight protein-tyrosine-phosphatase [Roseovarius sp. EGI FJ00037]MCZ0813246.1 low molecular weight phosphotyrosine protein phosphatase [Roseovarius sp. EGI FJ00037]
MTTRILFVCLGNICRSPAAEGVLRSLTPDLALTIDSAGTGGWHLGEPPYGPMQEAARRRGHDLSSLRARQFHAGDFDDFDLIVAMDRDNLQLIESLRPAGVGTPVRLLTDFAPESGMSHVPDPYYTRDFDGVLELIEQAARGLRATL